MRNIIFAFFTILAINYSNAQIITFPDANFKAKLLSASPSNNIASTDTPVYNNGAVSVSYYSRIDTNYDGEIQVSEAQNIRYLVVNGGLTNLTGIEYFTNLKSLGCYGNITTLNISQNTALFFLSCSGNQLTSLDLSQNVLLKTVYCSNNNLASINVSQNTALELLEVQNNSLVNLDVSQNALLKNLYCNDNQITSLNISNNPSLQRLYCYSNQLSSLNFSNTPVLETIGCEDNQLSNLDVSNCPSLNVFNCSNNLLSNLDVSNNPSLSSLYCGNNLLSSLDVSTNSALVTLYCNNNQLSNLNVSNNLSLGDLHCNHNQLSNLDVSSNLSLNELVCNNNQLTNINFTSNSIIGILYCQNNQLVNLDLSNSVQLGYVICSNNNITVLDLSNSPYLMGLDCKNNPNLQHVNIKNGNKLTTTGWYQGWECFLDFSNNPSLNFLCVDDGELADINSLISSYGYITCNANTYCSFVSGGTIYTIQGIAKLDTDANGNCEVTDTNVPNMKYSISNGTASGTMIANASGNYSISVQAGTYTVTPVLENPTYFNVSPTSTTVTFPPQPSPFTQDFCLVTNGTHSDLEVVLLSLLALPGSTGYFKLIYRNKGTNVQSGTLNLQFDDAIMDYVTASTSVMNQTTNNLSWDFTNLQPFETREIILFLRLNSPTETPPVNMGDVLNYTATITSVATDETPTDNTFTLNQTVVNSFDPNDKTCLEGTTIAPSEVGKYVHYLIRFENTGTFPAENIVVKDMIDGAKFDVSSLVPIKGSHDFFTRIDGNKVEFIFENINLPFDDANNDGYVAFKIKTKPTLVNGDTFSNSASIYFDYNFPIVTNTATTTIQALSTQDYEFTDYFNVYPNPVNTVLNIDAKQTIEVSSISIYNQLGQLVLVIPNAQNTKTVDVSRLSSGNYFIKINSDKGTSNAKFIKR